MDDLQREIRKLKHWCYSALLLTIGTWAFAYYLGTIVKGLYISHNSLETDVIRLAKEVRDLKLNQREDVSAGSF